MSGLSPDDATIGILIIGVLLFTYSILGSIDFGAGFWAMLYGRGRETRASELANRYLSPTWKVTNVFLVLFVVALVGFFPRAMYVLASLLLVPVCLVLILLTVRSTFMVFAYSADKYRGLLRVVSGITGMLIPALLVSVLPTTLGGFIVMTPDGPQLDYGRLLSSPTEYAHLAFGFASELFLAALFLADYAREAEDEAAYAVYRRASLLLGPLTLMTAVLVTYTMVPEAQWIVAKLERQVPLFGLSVAAFALGYTALFWHAGGGRIGRPRLAIVLVIAQYASASFAYGRAHYPYIVYPIMTIEEGFTNKLMFQSLLIGYTLGALVMVPSFILFWRLFLKDKRYLRQE
ncbi:cytochrome d ubiquinol oxidase subunit II [Paenibacillus chartarius]|uniref:Cytochrome d ubiquinol oxidase subunit II n=1 Tax=Paenibacillus chartarius TaxID=747481 RepID=A0ABV6DUG8_9BACL